MLIAALSANSSAHSQTNESTLGMVLYNQLKLDLAIRKLKKEADWGNVNSRYYFADALRKRSRYMTAESQQWYETAGDNGSIFAMIQLGRQYDDLCRKMTNCPAGKKSSADWLLQAKKQHQSQIPLSLCI
ncbi:hypothetical protein J3P75_14505 [Pseudomonas sp. R1-1]|uniref:hypothetical protein n=1 Tax=Pseudomonas sp. R1-1 TaxID=1602529 RepID=UPI003DA8C53C